MAAYWLMKEEPTHYSYDDLVRDGRTEWNGVHNALALRHLKAMRKGDAAFLYASGSRREVVGVMKISAAPHPDPADDRGSWSIEVRPVQPLPRPVTLAEIKADPAFARFELVRISRLSIMPVPPAWWARIHRMSRSMART